MPPTQPSQPYLDYRDGRKEGFWGKANKRKVFPYLGLFLASGFLVLEGADQLIDRGAFPDWSYWLVLIIYLYGVPGTVFLAWYHGERGTQKIERVEYLLHGSLVFGAIATCYFALPDVTGLAAASHSTYRVNIELPRDHQLSIPATIAFPFAISPDGQQLVYVATMETGTALVLRHLEAFDFTPLPETEGARQPFYSSDGTRIGFFADRKLMSIPAEGGAPFTIAELPGVTRGASWGQNDTILLSISGLGLWTVPASGGELDPLLHRVDPETPDRGDGDSEATSQRDVPFWPDILPDGKHALVSYGENIGLLSLSTGVIEKLLTGRQARYLRSGHILFAESGGHLARVPFDTDELEVTGPSVPVLEEVFQAPGGGSAFFAVSSSGTLVYVKGGVDRALTLVDRSGRRTSLTSERRGYRWPRFDPLGERLAFTVDPTPSDLWLFELGQGTASRETTDGHHVLPTWSPDGRHLAFNSETFLYLWEVGNGSEPVRVEGVPRNHYPLSWSPDGRVLVLSKAGVDTGLDIALFFLDEGLPREERYKTFLANPEDESTPQFSPDGNWMAYTSNAMGLDQVYVRPYPGPGLPNRISVGGGRDALWSRDGKELFFRKGDSVLVVGIEGGTGRATTTPDVLFTGEFDRTQMLNWDVSKEGRFVMVEGDPTLTRQFHLVIHWLQEAGAPPAEARTADGAVR